MLRLKQAIDECNIKQQVIATLTGWSKTQISITLNSGKLPADAERFKASIRAFVEITPPIVDWLTGRFMCPEDLFTNITDIAIETVPEWRCEQHRQIKAEDCRDCQRRFDGFMRRQHGRAAVLGVAA